MRYKLHSPPLAHLEAGARWLRTLARLGSHEVAGLDARAYLSRLALPAAWRTRDKLTQPELPPPTDLQTWAALGASDALATRQPRVNSTDQRPCALAYAAAYVAVFGAYAMTPQDVSTQLHIPPDGIPPALAAAWVQAAKKAPLLLRDATNESTGHYTSADGVANQARKTLADQDLLWTIVGDSISAPTLSTSDIGSRAYVGDVSLHWMLVHGSGAVLRGTSMAAVVAMKATPHDKAVQAAKTFLSGNVLRGLLCFVREDKHSTDARLDRESKAVDDFVYCQPETAQVIGTLCHQLASLRNTTRDAVFSAAWTGAGFGPNADVTAPRQLSPDEATKVHMWLAGILKKIETADDQRQPGEDRDAP